MSYVAVGVVVELAPKPFYRAINECFFMGVLSSPRGRVAATEAEPILRIPSTIAPPFTEKIYDAIYLITVHTLIITRQLFVNLALKLRRELFISIEIQHPLLRATPQTKSFLLDITGPGTLLDVHSKFSTYLEGPIF
jgi:hypothetical protein